MNKLALGITLASFLIVNVSYSAPAAPAAPAAATTPAAAATPAAGKKALKNGPKRPSKGKPFVGRQ